MNMSFTEIVYNWIYACGMGVVTALVLIGIPAVIGTLMEKHKNEHEFFNMIIDRLKKESAEERLRVFTFSFISHLPKVKIPDIVGKLKNAQEKTFDKIFHMFLYSPIDMLIFSIAFGLLGVDRFMLKDYKMGILKLITTIASGTLIFFLFANDANLAYFLNDQITFGVNNFQLNFDSVLFLVSNCSLALLCILGGIASGFFLISDWFKIMDTAKEANYKLMIKAIEGQDVKLAKPRIVKIKKVKGGKYLNPVGGH